jgi:hypothetical protein
VGKPLEKQIIIRPRMKLEDNIKMDPREIGYKDGGWTELAWNQVQWWILIFGINRC